MSNKNNEKDTELLNNSELLETMLQSFNLVKEEILDAVKGQLDAINGRLDDVTGQLRKELSSVKKQMNAQSKTLGSLAGRLKTHTESLDALAQRMDSQELQMQKMRRDNDLVRRAMSAEPVNAPAQRAPVPEEAESGYSLRPLPRASRRPIAKVPYGS